MSSYAKSVEGSRFVVHPIEREHGFRPGPDPYLCISCSRPRCLHARDNFIPRPSKTFGNEDMVNMDPRVRYGRHPRFYRPGTLRLNREEQALMDKRWKHK